MFCLLVWLYALVATAQPLFDFPGVAPLPSRPVVITGAKFLWLPVPNRTDLLVTLDTDNLRVWTLEQNGSICLNSSSINSGMRFLVPTTVGERVKFKAEWWRDEGHETSFLIDGLVVVKLDGMTKTASAFVLFANAGYDYRVANAELARRVFNATSADLFTIEANLTVGGLGSTFEIAVRQTNNVSATVELFRWSAAMAANVNFSQGVRERDTTHHWRSFNRHGSIGCLLAYRIEPLLPVTTQTTRPITTPTSRVSTTRLTTTTTAATTRTTQSTVTSRPLSTTASTSELASIEASRSDTSTTSLSSSSTPSSPSNSSAAALPQPPVSSPTSDSPGLAVGLGVGLTLLVVLLVVGVVVFWKRRQAAAPSSSSSSSSAVASGQYGSTATLLRQSQQQDQEYSSSLKNLN